MYHQIERKSFETIAISSHVYKNECYFNYIAGFCLQYNPARDRLESDYSRKCTEMIPPCPAVFVSTEIYKCKQNKRQKGVVLETSYVV